MYLDFRRPHIFDGWRLTRPVHNKDGTTEGGRADQVRYDDVNVELSSPAESRYSQAEINLKLSKNTVKNNLSLKLNLF